MELDDRAVSDHTAHLQIYSYSEMFEQALRSATGPLWPLAAPLSGMLLSRLFIVQGYLHSHDSPGMRMILRSNDSGHCLHVTPDDAASARATVAKVLRKLWRLSPLTGCIPLTPMLQCGKAGRGFHSGGWLPMKNSPGELDSDTMGRPWGMRHVHVIDSSVLPSIPATTITYTVMANAHRIAANL